ncbi:probable serine/threonine-protein kinase DDB_G0282963 [Panonychus citri]|uniref:probable serine/threonine-protein kinase DDB_G0282963 n=1 Tax=Panonychus citri TaxID=50023 RepID=UPI002306E144|nr:probable serine/threonine-protein kinase DDB_G0282963 [Panonychus citri]XP_053209193.1 probable serine/threonine-protein kinase DDB_G0282963 [Panonychus citri]
MISRKKILSKSCDKLINDCKHYNDQEIWFNKDKLFKDHLGEILDKWDQIDDDIWAKVIFMEKNRRVAKAYVRAQVITFNGSERGFDGHLVGLSGFVNSKRDERTTKVLEGLGEGIKMKIDESGDILIKRLTRSNIKVSGGSSDYNCLGGDLIETNGRVEMDKAMTLFQMRKLITTIGSEMKSTYPNQKKLEAQCITCVSIDIESENLLETPCWMMVINIVAMEVIKYKLPCFMMRNQKIPDFVAIFDQQQQQQQQQQIQLQHQQQLLQLQQQQQQKQQQSVTTSNSNKNNQLMINCSNSNQVIISKNNLKNHVNSNNSINSNSNGNNNSNVNCCTKVDQCKVVSVPMVTSESVNQVNLKTNVTNNNQNVKRKSETRRESHESSPSPPYKENKECHHHHHHHHHRNHHNFQQDEHINQQQINQAIKQMKSNGKSGKDRAEVKEVIDNHSKSTINSPSSDSDGSIIQDITTNCKNTNNNNQPTNGHRVEESVKIEIPMPDYDKFETNGNQISRENEAFLRSQSEKITDDLLLNSLPKLEETCLYQLNGCLNGHHKSTGYLNSAMRRLPVNSRLSSCSSSSDSSQSSGSEPSYYHIYSSIGDGIKITNCLPTNHLHACDKIIRYYVGNWE